MVPWMHQSTLTCQMDCPASQFRQGSICFHSFAATLGAWIRSQWTLRMLCEDEHNKDQLHFFGRETLDFVVVFLCTANCVAKQMEHYEILYVLCPSAGKTWIHPFDCQNQNLLWLWRLSHCQSGGEGMKALFNIDWLFFFSVSVKTVKTVKNQNHKPFYIVLLTQQFVKKQVLNWIAISGRIWQTASRQDWDSFDDDNATCEQRTTKYSLARFWWCNHASLLFGADQDSETILVEGEIEEKLQQKLRWVKICLQASAFVLVPWRVALLFSCTAGFEATQWI